MSIGDNDRPDELRRKLLKSSALLGGAFAAGHALPYVKPGAESFVGTASAYQVCSPPILYEIPLCTAEDPAVNPGEVGDAGIVTNITATVVPIPPVGTLIDCVPTSDDPSNPTGNTATAGTDAAGVATFPNFNMSVDWPSPLLPVDTIVTFTHGFVAPPPSSCSIDTCETSLVVVNSPPLPPPANTLECTGRGLDPPNALHVRGRLRDLTATVKNAAGNGIPNAIVTLAVTTDDPSNPAANGSPFTAVTDASGVATFAALPMASSFPTLLPLGTNVTVAFTTPTSLPGPNPLTCTIVLPVIP